MAVWAQAQSAEPVASDDALAQQRAGVAVQPPSEPGRGGKVGLVRGVLKRLDPIHDQLLIHAFGGGDLRIGFDTQTQLLNENTRAGLTGIPVGSVVSVDTVIEKGKPFAQSVRMDSSHAVELNGQVVRYDAARSRLTLRDPMNPENVSLRITPRTTVINHGQVSSPQVLSPGMLVQVRFDARQNAVSGIEILAERGNSFTFEGRVVAVDLRSRVLALSNDSDQSVRELAIGLLDPTRLRLLREGADVSIQAEFDGERYNVRSVALVSHNP